MKRLLLLTVLFRCTAFAAHPQTVWDATELTRLQNQALNPTWRYGYAGQPNGGTLVSHVRNYLDRRPSGVDGQYLGAYAMLARIMEPTPNGSVYMNNALTMVNTHCTTTTWASDSDLTYAGNLAAGAIAYDVLYDRLSQAARDACYNKICTGGMYFAQTHWWTTDLVQNHNWVDYASLGLAGQALEGETGSCPQATTWQNTANQDFANVRFVQDLITDGSWHEGIGYGEFGLSAQVFYWLGVARRGGPVQDSNLLRQLGKYILYVQTPNHPRIFLATHGDWNWSRPPLESLLRWSGHRFADPYAGEAGIRWDLEGRALTPTPPGTDWLVRGEFGPAWALEFATFDPAVPPLDITRVPLDAEFDDQGLVVMRNSWAFGANPPDSDGLVVGLKAGVYGGRGNRDRIFNNCSGTGDPGGILNFGHDHNDDLGLWIYGDGGWLLPEQVAYKLHVSATDCATYPHACDDWYSGTRWHNSFLFDNIGQLGDDKSNMGTTNESLSCPPGDPHRLPWFDQRDAAARLVGASDHYAFASADGHALYPSTVGAQMLLRNVGLSRENGFVALQDRIILATPHNIQQVFHSLKPANTGPDSGSWIRLNNQTVATDVTPASNAVLGIRVLSPNNFNVSLPPALDSDSYWVPINDSGSYGYVQVTLPAPDTNVVFLEFLWPTKCDSFPCTNWDSRPNVQPLDASRPHRGFSAAVGGGSESWIYNLDASGTTSAGDLKIVGTSQGDIGIARYDGSGTPLRFVLEATQTGPQRALFDQVGARKLLDLGSNLGVLEVAFINTQANLSGMTSVVGVMFYGPTVTVVTANGAQVTWTRDDATGLITVTGQ